MIPYFMEDAIGVVDGSNRNFMTASTYKPGSLRVWADGLLRVAADDDGWTELGGKSFELKEAPIGQVKVAYVPI